MRPFVSGLAALALLAGSTCADAHDAAPLSEKDRLIEGRAAKVYRTTPLSSDTSARNKSASAPHANGDLGNPLPRALTP